MSRLVLLVLALATGCAHQDRALPGSGESLYASLALPAVGGGHLHPQALQGKVVVVYFMATWCFPCLADMPILEQVQQRLGSRGAMVVAVGMDLDGAKTLTPFVAQYRPPFPVLVATPQLIGGETAFGRIRGLPTTILFDRNGKIVAAYQGATRGENLLRTVEELVSR